MQPTGSAYTGTRASYVALSSITILALALICSIWTTEVSGTVALLGLLAIYLASQELLVLFMVFVPASIIIDIIRLSGTPHSTSGRGWLIFLQLLEMAAKVAGGVFAWSLYRSASAGEALSSYAAVGPSAGPIGNTYQRVEDPFATAYAPPRSEFGLGAAGHVQQAAGTHQHQHAPAATTTSAAHATTAAAVAPAAPHHDLV